MVDYLLYSKALSTLILFSHTALIIFLTIHILKFKCPTPYKKVKENLRENGLIYACTISILSTISPLIYSNLFNLEPCILCWYQRVFMFPIAIILTLSYLKKDNLDKIYTYTLAGIGLCLSLYHYTTQQLKTLGMKSVECNVVGITQSCAEYYFLEFGYITIPLMAATGFALIIFFIYHSKSKANKEKSKDNKTYK